MMKQNYLYWLSAILVVLLLLLAAVFQHQSESIERVYLDQVKQDLSLRTRLMLPLCESVLRHNSAAELKTAVKTENSTYKTRVSIIAEDGTVIADTDENPVLMDNHANRPEVAELRNVFSSGDKFAYQIRYSATQGRRMLYCSTPLIFDGKQYIVRNAVSIQEIDKVLHQSRRDIALTIALTVLFAVMLSFLILVLVSRPVQKLQAAAERIAAGNFDEELPIPKRGAIRGLALALTAMADELKHQIGRITREKGERDAIFASLAEGVIMLNMNGEIIDMNSAASRIFDIMPLRAAGTAIAGLVRNRQLDELIRNLRGNFQNQEMEMILKLPSGDRHLRLRATHLSWGEEHSSGILLVVYDLTTLRKLENYRRDFVANVSHEIKTPVTVIRGAVETLLDGAMEEADAAKRFLGILDMHSKRLTSLVDDILSLSDLECRSLEANRDDRELVELRAPAETAIELARARAPENMAIHLLDRSHGAKVLVDRQLVEQAVLNLLTNSIKYSETERPIEVELEVVDHQAKISVRDYGCGIAPEHLARIFERFYRVDRARSRKAGGTGLGLAIVKHIAQLHGGSVEAESKVGEGSTFSILLPLP